MNNKAQSTYRLLGPFGREVQGHHGNSHLRAFELSVVVSIFQFAQQHNQLPAALITEPSEIQYLSHQLNPDCDGQC